MTNQEIYLQFFLNLFEEQGRYKKVITWRFRAIARPEKNPFEVLIPLRIAWKYTYKSDMWRKFPKSDDGSCSFYLQVKHECARYNKKLSIWCDLETCFDWPCRRGQWPGCACRWGQLSLGFLLGGSPTPGTSTLLNKIRCQCQFIIIIQI